jgi:DNA primase
MDLLMSHQGGFNNAVASSGTALTEHQLTIMKRLSNKLVIAYDGDEAVQPLSKRGWELALGLAWIVKIANALRQRSGRSYTRKSQQFKLAIANAKHVIDVEMSVSSIKR